MSLSQRSAPRFYAAFFRWRLHTRKSRQCPFSSQKCQNSIVSSSTSYQRKYHATTLRQEHQPELQLKDDDTRFASKASQKLEVSATAQGKEGRSATSMLHEEETVVSSNTSAPSKKPPTELVEPHSNTRDLKNSVRSVMRKIPSSVAVITVQSVDPDTKKHVPMGVAVSSLTSVTLDPPTISFNIKEPSQTLDAIRAAHGRFRVHFPGADRGGANIVELFCRGNHTGAYNHRLKDLKIHVPSDTKDKRATASLAPQIWNDSIRAALECTVTHELPVADHVILAARVDSVEQKASKDPTIVYVDGKYMRSETTITSHGTSNAAAQSGTNWSVWDYTLFPKEKERQEYLEKIKANIKDNPDYLDKSSKDVLQDLELKFAYSPTNFGINIDVLLAECRKETGRKSKNYTGLENTPALADFYGRPTPFSLAKITHRASRLVKEDPRFLSLSYGIFLRYLNVGIGIRDLLPSDIMETLRAEGLVGDYKLKVEDRRTPNRTHYDIQKLEQVEHKLKKYLRTFDYEKASKTRFDLAMEDIGEDKFAATFFKKCRSRLLSESHPQQFDHTTIDIVGEVSNEEARVVLSRIITFLQPKNLSVFRKNISINMYEILRLNGVHPAISGIDIEYFFGKINHLFYSTDHFRDFAPAIEKMLEPWFDNTIKWSDLEQRVKEFVQTAPLRATSWSNGDKLAAMGLKRTSTVTVPAQDNQQIKQQLDKGHILDTLVAKELKDHYGNGTDLENQAIADFLKEVYSFDVHPKPTADTPQDSETFSSSDEMQEAMLAHRNVDVLAGNAAGQSKPDRHTHNYQAPRGDRQSSVNREASISSPRVQYLNNQDPNYNPEFQGSSTRSKKSRRWTTYSLRGGKKET